MIHAQEGNFEILEILGYTALFTSERIDRKTVPRGLLAYDLRHDDECQGEICEIRPYVLVNHWGTILTEEPIPLSDGGCRLVGEDDYNYTGRTVTLADFMAENSEEMSMSM